LLFTLVSCAGHGQRVIVVDQTGKPVVGATVVPVAPSINGAPTLTDSAGEAKLDTSVGGQPPRWISVHKAGFVGVDAPIPASWPLRVALTPVPAVIE
jgi:hypothetical protein